jgi:hypothetical protein
MRQKFEMHQKFKMYQASSKSKIMFMSLSSILATYLEVDLTLYEA